MKNLVCIIAGEPNSINSEIIGKLWKKKNTFKKKSFFIIGNYELFKEQLKKIKINIKIKKISDINNQNFQKELLILNVPLKYQNCFQVSKQNKNKYIFECFKIATDLARRKKILGFINCPVNKLEVFGNKDIGVTEFLAKQEKVYGKEVMLIYNNKFSVTPITTHIKIKKVSNFLTKKLVINKLITLNKFFIKTLKFKPKIALLGLNPHNYEFRKNSEEIKILIPAIKFLKKCKISVEGPLSGDTAFINPQKKGFDVIVGMYHDQVLSPFKALFKFNAINISLGLPYIRISPDHGTGQDIIKKNLADPQSLIESIKFFNKINART